MKNVKLVAPPSLFLAALLDYSANSLIKYLGFGGYLNLPQLVLNCQFIMMGYNEIIISQIGQSTSYEMPIWN